MNVLFEEEGAFRAGTILSDQTSSLQVETSTGRRAKVKATHVLLRFDAPTPGALMDLAEAEAEKLETDFLWEVCPETEFGFEELAAEYFGQAPSAVEQTSVLLRLHSAPVYFHRKGRGRFRRAPADILKAALAGLEKKRLQAQQLERMVTELKAFQLPGEFSPVLRDLLYRPDRNRMETKALEAASAELGMSPIHLLDRCGAIPSAHDFHLGKLLVECFPDGVDFPSYGAVEADSTLPVARVRAFSIDDAATTEIDDAFSVSARAEGGWTIGIHIAAPGLGIRPGSELDRIARARLSTVYMPGNKITMLPSDVIDLFTLNAGAERPALSLYLTVASDFRILATRSCVERVPVVANLRHHDLEPVFNEATLAGALPEFAFREELVLLWHLATVLEAGRGKPSAFSGFDFNYYVDGEHIRIEQRPRGSPLDKLVSELMILANSTWGGLLAEKGIPGIYRAQTGGKVRMTTSPQPHDGLGVSQYAWSTSPLRRYVDLLNQWQLLASINDEAAPFPPKSEALLTAMRDFDVTYTTYADFQRGMERYWCLRWLLQEEVSDCPAQVIREGLVRLERLPLVLRTSSLPALETGTRVTVTVSQIDLLVVEANCRFVAVLSESDLGGQEG